MDTGSRVATIHRWVSQQPSCGIHRNPAVVWHTPRLHPTASDLVVVEDHGGFAYGGNKVRHLDLILGRALREKADVLLTAAGTHSNLCRVLAAAARYLGLEAHLVQRGEAPTRPTGNQILYSMLEVPAERVAIPDPFSPVQDQQVATVASRYRAQGRRPFIVDVRRRHAPISALAQTQILDEVDLPWVPDTLVVASSAGSTAAGLLLGVVARAWRTRVLAVSANTTANVLRPRILAIAEEAAQLAGLDLDGLDLSSRLVVDDGFVGAGHGIRTQEATEAASRTARTSGLFLDGTYTGKAMAALLHDTNPGRACFVHTGGGPTVFHDHADLEATT